MQMMHIASKHVRIYIYIYSGNENAKKEEKESNYFFNTTALAGLVWGEGGGQNIEYRWLVGHILGEEGREPPDR